MRTLLPDPPPPEFEALLERRRQWGADHHDEAWEGVLHMNPAPQLRHADVHAQLLYLLRAPAHSAGLRVTADFNLGEPGDYRVPDGGLHHPGEAQLYCTTAALAVEVLSPGDETWNKLPFYADHQVDEVLIVDPDEGEVSWLVLERGEYQPVRRSGLLERRRARPADRLARLTAVHPVGAARQQRFGGDDHTWERRPKRATSMRVSVSEGPAD